MKTLNFNKNSWHFKLATKLGGYEAPFLYECSNGDSFMAGDSADICTYSKCVAFSLFLVAIITTALVFVSTLVIHALLGIYFSISTGQWFFSEFGESGIILFGIAVLLAGLYSASQKFSNYREKNRHKPKSYKPDTFLDNAYKAWKNKFCVPIKFNE